MSLECGLAIELLIFSQASSTWYLRSDALKRVLKHTRELFWLEDGTMMGQLLSQVKFKRDIHNYYSFTNTKPFSELRFFFLFLFCDFL